MSENVIDVTAAEAQAEASKGEAVAVLTRAGEIVVTSHDEATEAAVFRNEVKARWNKVEEQRKYLKEPYLVGGRRIDEFFKPVLEFLNTAQRQVDTKLSAYQQEQERKRWEAEAEAARLAEREQERLAKLAEKATARGDEEKAAEFLDRADTVPVTVAPPPPKVAGITMADNWKADLTDMAALVKAASEGNALALAMLSFNQIEANRKAKALRGAVTVPGVRIWNDRGVRGSKS